MLEINLRDLGIKDYKETWDYQEQLLSEVYENKKLHPEGSQAGYLLLVEHPHVFTLGKSGEVNNLLISEPFLKKIQASFYRINRGGDITYHGPGQLVGYPIVDLEKFKMGVREYIQKLEEAIILTLKDYGIEAGRMPEATGVWLEPSSRKARKICAMGVRVSRFITMHGFALNVNTDLNYFSYINPCGFQDKGVTSLAKELGRNLEMPEVKQRVITHMTSVFNTCIE